MAPSDPSRPEARSVKGFRDLFAADLLLKHRMIATVRQVYERYGFVPLETPALEFVDVLGKFLPESHTPEGGVFALRNPDLDAKADPRSPDTWLALRYDLTAPLARVAAQYADLPRPFRRYQVGPVWRVEKPGPGRFREFVQFDFDSVGVPDVAADAEVCMVMCDVLEALGFARGEYVVKVSNRKVMQGLLEVVGFGGADINDPDSKAAEVLRSIDKLDRIGLTGVRLLLGKGRLDPSGDFTTGAGLDDARIETVAAFLAAQVADRGAACDRMAELIGASPRGAEGVAELRRIDALLSAAGYGADRVVFDPAIVRGLAYYTGPVFEGQITKRIVEDGEERQFGTVFGGGRYDTLVERFTGQKVPATGASVGVDRLLEAMKLLAGARRDSTSEALVTVLDPSCLDRYFAMARELRDAGIACEVFLGEGGIRKQLKYADRTGIPVAVIAGGDEFSQGTVQLKDLALGRALSANVATNEEWKRDRPAQRVVPRGELVAAVREMVGA